MIQVGLEVEHSPRIDAPGEDVAQKVWDVLTRWRHTAAQTDVAEDHGVDRDDIVGRSHGADHRARARNRESGRHRFTRPYTLESRFHAEASCHLFDRLDSRVAALGDDVGSAEFSCYSLARRVPRQSDDPIAAKAFRS